MERIIIDSPNMITPPRTMAAAYAYVRHDGRARLETLAGNADYRSAIVTRNPPSPCATMVLVREAETLSAASETWRPATLRHPPPTLVVRVHRTQRWAISYPAQTSERGGLLLSAL